MLKSLDSAERNDLYLLFQDCKYTKDLQYLENYVETYVLANGSDLNEFLSTISVLLGHEHHISYWAMV